MNDKLRCHSCGMPLSKDFDNFGTNKDGSSTSEYCKFCFVAGKFTIPDQTINEMIQISIEHMTDDLNLPIEQATQLANSFIPQLKRWKKL